MITLPKIGCGTWTYNDKTAREYVLSAIEAGYRLIDTAAYYGNEKGVGAAVAACGLDRGEVFVTSKLWKTELGYRRAKEGFYRSLDRLGLTYLDCFLIHWPAVRGDGENWQEINDETWRALEELHAEGLIRAIGVSNFAPRHLQALHWTVKPMIDQIEFHPGFMQKETVDYCRAEGISLQAWSPFGRGEVFSEPTVKRLAEKYGTTPALVCLGWIGAHGLTPIVKSANPARQRENLKFGALTLAPEDMAAMDAIKFFGRLGYDPETVNFHITP